MLPSLHSDFSRGRLGGLVFPSLSEFSTVSCDTHSQRLGLANIAEIDVFFWNSLVFSMIQRMLAIWSLVPLPLLKSAWTPAISWFTYYWSLAWRILSITLLTSFNHILIKIIQFLQSFFKGKWKIFVWEWFLLGIVSVFNFMFLNTISFII